MHVSERAPVSHTPVDEMRKMIFNWLLIPELWLPILSIGSGIPESALCSLQVTMHYGFTSPVGIPAVPQRPFVQSNGPLTRYVKLRVVHAPGMPETFSLPLRISDPDMHHGTCVTHVPWCMPGLLTSGFLWSRWWGKRFRHSRRMRNLQFYVSDKRPMCGPNDRQIVCR